MGINSWEKLKQKYFLFTAAAALTRSVALCKGRLLPPVCGQALYTESGNPSRKSVFPMTDQVTAPFWQPHSQVSQASESWQIFFAILFIWEEKRCLDRFFNCTYSTQLRKDLSMIFICSYECTPIKHIIHKPNCEMMCEILSRPSSLSSSYS